MVLALLWQLAHAVLLAPVNVHSCTELESLLLPGEEHSAAPDELLFRWLNHHLHQGNRHERVASWTDPNLRSGVAYAVLLDEVAPPPLRPRLSALREAALAPRRARVLLDLETLGVTAFRLSADGIAAASPKLHRCLAAAIFGRHPGLRTAETADATPRRQADYGLASYPNPDNTPTLTLTEAGGLQPPTLTLTLHYPNPTPTPYGGRRTTASPRSSTPRHARRRRHARAARRWRSRCISRWSAAST